MFGKACSSLRISNLCISEYVDTSHHGTRQAKLSAMRFQGQEGVFNKAPERKSLFVLKIKIKQNPDCPKKE